MIREGDWVWLSAFMVKPDNWFGRLETLGRVRALSDRERPKYLVEHFDGDEARTAWFAGYELWPCRPDEGEIAEWIGKILAS